MSRTLAGSICGVVLATVMSGAAQSPQLPLPQRPPQQTPPKPTPPTRGAGQPVTVEGCLVREGEAARRVSNDPQRAGDEYVLTMARMIRGRTPGDDTTRPVPDESKGQVTDAVDTYKVGGLDDETLMKHLGQRVQVDGTLDHVARASEEPEANPNADDLVEIVAMAIRQVPGDCAPK